MSPHLHDFVGKALERGLSRDHIRQTLRQAGWPDADIVAALRRYAEVDFPVPVPRPQPQLRARDAFLYMLMFGVLYACVWHVGHILFSLIDQNFPDPRQTRYHTTLADNIRLDLASLLIVAPLFIGLFRHLSQAVRLDPSRRISAVRRWLTYWTLLGAAGTLIGDMIHLLFNLLDGGLTLPIFLKSLTIAGLAGGGFLYFLFDVRSGEQE